MRLVLKSAAITWLVFAGLTYCAAGVWGLIPNGDLIEAFAWSLLISPYVWVSYLNSHGASFDVISRVPHASFSQAAILVGLVAVIAAVGLAWGSKFAYWTWVALLILGGMSVVGYVAASWPIGDLSEALIPTCWELSYVGAFLLAARKVVEVDAVRE